VVNDPRLLRRWRVQSSEPDTVVRDPCMMPPSVPHHTGTGREQQVRAAQTRLLFENAGTGAIATILIVSVLAYAQWDDIPAALVVGWLMVMLLIAVGRYGLTRRYWLAAPGDADSERWNTRFVIGTTLAAAGWGAAAVVLNPGGQPMVETFLVFVIGGVMLGGAALLAARPEAFLAFLLPAGLITAARLASTGDEQHLMMGFLAAVFTAATVATTWRCHQIIDASLRLRFDNQELIESLQAAKQDAETLNRELELRVLDRTARLTEADQRKDEFLAMLAHELRNPLAPIRFAVDSLKGSQPPETAARARDVIDRQVRQLVRLVDDLLDVSRITANKMTLRREPHDLGALMATAVESIMPLATAADHTLTTEPPAGTVCVNGDAARLVQVFANVLNNAVKFTPRGGRIWFTAEDRGGEAVLRIRDTGIGIAPSELPRVFDMFQQAAPILDRSAGGLGIGLTLARRLVEMHDGRITIASGGSGQGTEVEIVLPVTVMPESRPAAADAAAAATGVLRVLIVEDNPDAAEMLELAVSTLGHHTAVAHDGATAVALASDLMPDVIFLDIGLPVMNGYAVARALRQKPEFAHVHIAAVTGWGQDEDRRKSREAGFDSHFTKPLSPVVLEQLLVALAQRAATGQEVQGAPRTRLGDFPTGV
jgi:signal transduction histidine kinase/ActR/RegA family two-component response regulator